MKKVEHLSINNDDAESCVVEIVNNSRKIIVLAIYCSPQGSLSAFSDFVLSALNDPVLIDIECIVTCDLIIRIHGCIAEISFIVCFRWALFHS